jgi:hypothetical protein
MFIMLMFPVLMAALLGGMGPGLLATLLAMLGIDLMSTPNFHSADSTPVYTLQWGFLGLCGITVSLFSGMLRHLGRRNKTHRNLLDAVVSGTSDAVFVKDEAGALSAGE